MPKLFRHLSDFRCKSREFPKHFGMTYTRKLPVQFLFYANIKVLNERNGRLERDYRLREKPVGEPAPKIVEQKRKMSAIRLESRLGKKCLKI